MEEMVFDSKDSCWSDVVSSEIIKNLSVNDIKRHEAIYELIKTECSYIRNLLVLKNLFLLPLYTSSLLSIELFNELFPDMDSVIHLHKNFYSQLKSRINSETMLVSNVGDIIYNEFDGINGDKFKNYYINFCRTQSSSMNELKKLIKKDTKLATFINNAETNPLCHRYKFADFHSSIYQRLTKYPLLVSCILNYTDKDNTKEYILLSKSEASAKAILNNVNEEMNNQQNKDFLADIASKLVWKISENNESGYELKEIDITQCILLQYGNLNWKLSKNKIVDVFALCLDKKLLITNKSDDQYIVRVYNDGKVSRNPIINLENGLVRDVATDKRAFFVVTVTALGPRIFEFISSNTTEKKTWIKAIQNSISAPSNQQSSSSISNPYKNILNSPPSKVKSKNTSKLESFKSETTSSVSGQYS